MIMNPFLKLPDIGYDKNLIALDKTDKGIVATYKDGSTKDVSIGEAIHAIVSAQTYFLLHSDKKPAALETISHPEDIIDCTVDQYISPKETVEYLSWLSMGLCAFTNNKSMADKIFKGIGYTIYALYLPFNDSNEKDVHNIFIKIITTSTCILQFSRKPLAKALYLGLYSHWRNAKNFHKSMFYEGNPDHIDGVDSFTQMTNDYRCEGYFENLLTSKDVFTEPDPQMHQETFAIKSYSIDNIILSAVALARVVAANDKHSFLTEEESKFLHDAYDATRVFLFKIIPLYKHTTNGYYTWHYHGNPYKVDRSYCMFRSEIKCNMAPYFFGKTTTEGFVPASLSMEVLPYVYYSGIILGQDKEWPFFASSRDLARKITHKPKKKLDLDKPFGYEKKVLLEKKHNADLDRPLYVALAALFIFLLFIIFIIGSLLYDAIKDGSAKTALALFIPLLLPSIGLFKVLESDGGGFIFASMYWHKHSSFWWS